MLKITKIIAAAVILASSTLLTAQTAPAIAASAAVGETGYAPHRVFESKRKRGSDFESMLAELAKADIVFLGEQHDDPRTHRLQTAVLEGLARRRSGPIVLALEMFERDAQTGLDAYLAGTRTETDFLAAARPWPNYATDYRPMVEFAKSRNWPVVGGNVPRRLAQVVSRRGMIALDSVPETDRPLIAAERSCPRDEYWDRFKTTMGDMSGHGVQMSAAQVDAMVWRFYESQCLKDETMGEAVAAAWTRYRTQVVHANGAFHSDYRLGTVERVRRRLPQAKIAVVSFVPVKDLDATNGKAVRKLGDWVVFTLATPKAAAQTP